MEVIHPTAKMVSISLKIKMAKARPKQFAVDLI
jgi:hypothetical protein